MMSVYCTQTPWRQQWQLWSSRRWWGSTMLEEYPYVPTRSGRLWACQYLKGRGQWTSCESAPPVKEGIQRKFTKMTDNALSLFKAQHFSFWNFISNVFQILSLMYLRFSTSQTWTLQLPAQECAAPSPWKISWRQQQTRLAQGWAPTCHYTGMWRDNNISILKRTLTSCQSSSLNINKTESYRWKLIGTEHQNLPMQQGDKTQRLPVGKVHSSAISQQDDYSEFRTAWLDMQQNRSNLCGAFCRQEALNHSTRKQIVTMFHIFE